ncbi:MAG: hypothetical protein ACR2GX_04985 [Candidatus Dormibacteria bacterium]
MSLPRILCLMGSGETAPTMHAVHADLLGRLGDDVPAVLLDTPFGFQENADDLVVKAQEYFHRSVGRRIELASLRSAERATAVERETFAARVAAAGYVFAGPGSPSYALRQWRESELPTLLREKLRRGGVVTFGSAAAVSLGVVSLPVYEIYKVGEVARWLDGLDVLSEIGLRVAVVPHFNNAEGGGHDTRFCYMGERRLRDLEAQLPDGATVLGVDEHTALVIDVGSGRVEVRGRGRVTMRCSGRDVLWEAGASLTLDELRAAAAGDPAEPHAVMLATADATPIPAGATPFQEHFDELRERIAAADAGRDAPGIAGAILAIDTLLMEWQEDSLESDERDQARALLRRMVARLADLAAAGTGDPRERVAPFVDGMLELRASARDQRRYADADRIRDILTASGVEIRDAPSGTEWSLPSR